LLHGVPAVVGNWHDLCMSHVVAPSTRIGADRGVLQAGAPGASFVGKAACIGAQMAAVALSRWGAVFRNLRGAPGKEATWQRGSGPAKNGNRPAGVGPSAQPGLTKQEGEERDGRKGGAEEVGTMRHCVLFLCLRLLALPRFTSPCPSFLPDVACKPPMGFEPMTSRLLSGCSTN
jgi:hypothetical protein